MKTHGRPIYYLAAVIGCLALIAGAVILLPKFFTETDNKYPSKIQDAKLSYHRTGVEETIFPSYSGSYSFNELCSESAAIVDLTIIEWLSENNDGMPKTFYKAKINSSLKGDLKEGDEITLRQDGNSKATLEGFPLFSVNDSIISFLAYEPNFDYYYLINGDDYICDIIEYEQEVYALKRFNDFEGLSGLSTDKNLKNSASKNVREYAQKRDPLLTQINENRNLYDNMFIIDDLVAIIEKNVGG